MADYRSDADNTNTVGWIIGAIIVLLVLAGIWWVATSSATPSVPNTGVPATDTSTGASSTGSGTGY